MAKRLRKETNTGRYEGTRHVLHHIETASVWQEKEGILVMKHVLTKLKIALDQIIDIVSTCIFTHM